MEDIVVILSYILVDICKLRTLTQWSHLKSLTYNDTLLKSFLESIKELVETSLNFSFLLIKT